LEGQLAYIRGTHAALPGTLNFNPRPRVREATGLPFSSSSPQHMFQSTPPQGRRRLPPNSISISSSFNPRPRKGGDGQDRPDCGHGQGFNPRPRKGGDRWRHPMSMRSLGFNPRPRKGGDVVGLDVLDDLLFVSIHAPAREAT